MGDTGRRTSMLPARGVVPTPSTVRPSLPMGPDRSGSIAKMPMEPVMVAGLAHTSSAAMLIQYPPEAATEPMDTTTGLPALRVRASSRRMTSDAVALPPGLSTRSTTALMSSLSRA